MTKSISQIFALLLLASYSLVAQSFEPKPLNGELIQHTYYALSYTEKHEQAEWVYYILKKEMASGTITRTDNFRVDPLVTTFSASLKDYVASGYDRGHLAPAGDMTLNAQAMSESFYLSNMSPQLPALNRGAWKNLEALFRGWTLENEALFVVTGPIFKDNIGVIGKNQVTIPGYYYKIAYSTSAQKMIGFVLPNHKVTAPLLSFVVTIDSIEALTGIDFYYQLDDTTENHLESTISTESWDFNIKKVQKRNADSSNITSTQCLGIAKSTGNRCKNSTKFDNGYCNRHQSQVNGK